ncbi:hypothetical protein AWB78_05336 [Caballeronia calidae]|uniref:Uncharacterized protein n=1 Tax=Caballeronia calidae TaxID=1777139 RepID=A0A158DL90_9BURK|nr:hypothetical protein [Caballeronia calidae]SAK95401.1 hypothetical protein AWB78_05336 [Caballeronia calidae]
MALRKRILKVTFHMPAGDVVFDESTNLKVHVKKDCMSSQNRAVIEIGNMTESVRQELLSEFTAFNRRKTATGQKSPAYLDMEITAGYIETDGKDTSTVIYHGQVVECGIMSSPPNMVVRITCYTHQVDKVSYFDQAPPFEMNFKELVYWAGDKMGFDRAHVTCDTSHDNDSINNAARSIYTAGDLPLYLEQYFYPDVAAYIDDNFLIVKDRYKVLNPSDTVHLSDFIGMPCWNEWGVEFTTFFDSSIKCAQAATLNTVLNKSMNDGQWIVMSIDYELTSRDAAFYCHVLACPPA